MKLALISVAVAVACLVGVPYVAFACVNDNPKQCTCCDGSTKNVPQNGSCSEVTCPCGGTAQGVPVLGVSRDQCVLTVKDTPIKFNCPLGPVFSFDMQYSISDFRGTNEWPWSIGYHWSHGYERCILQNGTNYQMYTRGGFGSEFTCADGVSFVEANAVGNQGTYTFEWQGSNIVACLRTAKDWTDQKSHGGCSTCGGSAGSSPSVNPPHAAWHANEGFTFEPDPNASVVFSSIGGTQFSKYRLKKVTGPDGLDMTINYNTNDLISSMVSASGNEFDFSYSPSLQLTNILDVTGNRSATFSYSNNCLVQAIDMVGQTFQYGYDTNLNLSSLGRPNATGGFDTTTIAYQGSYTAEGVFTITVTYPDGQTRFVSFSGPIEDTFNDAKHTMSYFEPCSYGSVMSATVDRLGRTNSMAFYDVNDSTNLNINGIATGYLKQRTAADGTSSQYQYDSQGRLIERVDRDAASNIVLVTTWNFTYFPGTACLSNMTVTAQDANSNILSQTSTTYSRFDTGLANPTNDVYTLVSEKTWVTTNQYEENKYIYDTNTWLLSQVQQLVGPDASNYRTVKQYTYNASQQVVSILDAASNATYPVYDLLNRVVAITNAPSGGTAKTTQYAFDNLDRITNMIYPDGISALWSYADCGCGEATNVDRGGNVIQTTYDPDDRVKTKTLTSPNGTILSYASYDYNSFNQIIATYDLLSNSVQNVYDDAGDMTEKIDQLGRITSYFYDYAGRQYMTVFADGSVSSNSYDLDGRLMEVARYASSTSSVPLTFTTYAHDALGRVVATTDALGNVTSSTFDLAGKTITTTFADGSYSETEFDLLNNVIEQIAPVPAGATQQQLSSATTSNSYDVLNRLVSTTDPQLRVTSYSYSADWPQKVATTIDANYQVVQQNFYDPLLGYLLTNVSYEVTMSYAYDFLGQNVQTIWPDGSFAVNTYDGTRLIKQTSRTGNTTSFGFDLDGRTTSMTNSLGAVTLYYLDAFGNRTNVTDALTNQTLYIYDSMNRLTVTTRPDGSATTNTWDQLGRLVAKTGAGSVPVSYGYDADSRMTALVDGMTNTTTFQYDQLSRLIQKIYADGSFYQYTYNARGWLTQRTDAKGVATGYVYNNDGQLTNVNYATDTDVQYYLDNLGRATGRVDSAGTWTSTYDQESSRVLSETLSGQSTVSYSYAPNTFDLASVGCGSSTTLYSWAAGRLTNVTALSASSLPLGFAYSYVPNSDLLQQTAYLGGTVTVYRAYDVLNRLTSISAANNSAAINSFAYQLDSLGRRVQRTDVDNSQTQWKYDNYDQLTNGVRSGSANGAADAAYNFGYIYDKVGNRLQESRGQLILTGAFNDLNQVTHLAWNGNAGIVGSVASTNAAVLVQGYTNAPPFYNQTNWLGEAAMHEGSNNIAIVAWQGTNYSGTNVTVFMPPLNPEPFSWDANGNMLSDGQRNLTWDNENRLIAIETKANLGLTQLRSEYLYDAQSRRIQKIDKSGWNGTVYATTNVTKYVWDGWLLLAELNADNSLKAYNVHGLDLSQSMQGAGGIGGLLCRIEGGNNYLYTFDGNGNVVDVLSGSGSPVAHYEFDPFGRTVAQSGSYASQNPWRFSTKQIEPTWDLYYYGHRFYSPSLHTWLNRDPIWEPAFLDQYEDYITAYNSALLHENNPECELYLFVMNRATEGVDPLGLRVATTTGADTHFVGCAAVLHHGLPGQYPILFNTITYTLTCNTCEMASPKPAAPHWAPGKESQILPDTYDSGKCGGTAGTVKLSIESRVLGLTVSACTLNFVMTEVKGWKELKFLASLPFNYTCTTCSN
jgi:RHS repeat-associated protein